MPKVQLICNKKRNSNTRGLSEKTFDYFYKNLQVNFIPYTIKEIALQVLSDLLGLRNNIFE